MTTGRTNSAGLRRDLELLQVLGGAEAWRQGGLGVVRIAALAGREKSQVSRALSTLAEAGLVYRDEATLTYRLGWRLYSLAARTFESYLVTTATPFLRSLADRAHETAHLCVLRGDEVVTLATTTATTHALGLAWKDLTFSAPASSPGRVLLSEWHPDEIRSRFTPDRLAHLAARRVFGDADELLAELAAVRRRGYAVVDEEFEEGVVGYSAPVRDARGCIVAALNLEAPKSRLGPRLDAAGHQTVRVAAELSAAISGTQARDRPQLGPPGQRSAR